MSTTSATVQPNVPVKKKLYLKNIINGVSEGKYEDACKNGYLFDSWNPEQLSEDYNVSYSITEDIYGALISSFLFLARATSALVGVLQHPY